MVGTTGRFWPVFQTRGTVVLSGSARNDTCRSIDRGEKKGNVPFIGDQFCYTVLLTGTLRELISRAMGQHLRVATSKYSDTYGFNR